MTRPSPRLAALAAAATVLLGYVLTLAPTVTLWDAGEFIAAAKTLGIPHPPGTPLFVMVGHVWGALVPLAEYAERLNLLSATLSAAASGFFFLVVHESLTRPRRAAGGGGGEEAGWPEAPALAGAAASVLIAAFTFTLWQNSNETEVYAGATFTIGAIAWLCFRWRATRGSERAGKLLLMVLYLAGLSIGNHLLALLVGPAVVAFLAVTLRSEPSPAPDARAAEWAQVSVVAGAWVLLIGLGLGSAALSLLGLLAFLGALGMAWRGRSIPFAVLGLLTALIGTTTYLFLFIRAGHHPVLNEAQPDTWESLLAVIRRAQYPPRTPLDDPTVPHGPGNPGRSPMLFWYQLLNYFQYFHWQWANGLSGGTGRSWLQAGATVLFGMLGVQGMLRQRRRDPGGWWLLLLLWLVTGLGLVVYMNFRPGYSLGFDRFPDPEAHEVRERDYFFVVSFLVWGLWAGMGLAGGLRSALERWRVPAVLASIPLLLVALIPLAGNFTVASRRHGPGARLASDFAYNLLNSVPPYGVLFTYGDNDTFPLWWAQEVEGVRRDVRVVCLALAETPWYKRQLRDNPERPFDAATAPALWREAGAGLAPPDRPLHSLTDLQIDQAIPAILPEDVSLQIGPLRHTLRKGTPLYSQDFLVLRLLQDNLGRRPIAWSLTTGRNAYGLGSALVQQGLVMVLQPSPVDTLRADLDLHRVLGMPLDVPTTSRLVWETWRLPAFQLGGAAALEPSARGVASNLALPVAQLAYALFARGEAEQARRTADLALRLSPRPELGAALARILDEAPVEAGNRRP